MGKCVVKCCVSRSEKDDKAGGVTFHKVPKDQKRREKWIKNIRLLRKETDWLPTNATVICSKHFRDEDKILPMHDKSRVKLSDRAVPIVIDETESPFKTEVDLKVETDEELLELLEISREHEMRKTIKRLKFVSSNRLKCIKKLRQRNKRLEIYNKKLMFILKKYVKKCHLTEGD